MNYDEEMRLQMERDKALLCIIIGVALVVTGIAIFIIFV